MPLEAQRFSLPLPLVAAHKGPQFAPALLRSGHRIGKWPSQEERILEDSCDLFSISEAAAAIISASEQLLVDISSADAAHNRLGRYRVSERGQDGSLVLGPETVDEVVADVAARALSGEELLGALDRLDAAASKRKRR
jgi:hypothetical protein